MFDVNEFYKKAHSGLPGVDCSEVLSYIKSFEKVVIWGASYLGKAVGEFIINQGISLSEYWDMRKDELIRVNDVEVVLPFTGEKENTLVIFCIGNNVIRKSLLHELQKNGFTNVLRGDYFYEAMICPFNVNTGIESKMCQGSMCCRAMFCERLENIVKAKSKSEKPLSIYHVTLTINQKCSLKCKCCTSYMNEYELKERINIPFERIEKDIDLFFDAVDSVGSVTVMGGEPFMHPDLSKIIKKLLTKDNIGLICIATSATYPMNDEQLMYMDDPRVNISISNYSNSITDVQRKMMDTNMNKLKEKKLEFTLGVTMPEWIVPSTLYYQEKSTECLVAQKQSCKMPPRCIMIKNGKVHPCDFAAAVHCLKIADYDTDYVQLDQFKDDLDRKDKIKAFLEQDYYQVCGHCEFRGLTARAAEQGYMDFKKPLELQ